MKARKRVALVLGEPPIVLRSIDFRHPPESSAYFTADPFSFFESHHLIQNPHEFLGFCKEVKTTPRNCVRVGYASALHLCDFQGIARVRALYRGPDGTRRVLIDLTWAESNTRYTVTYLLNEGVFRDAVSATQKRSALATGGFSPHLGSFPDCYIWDVGKGRFRSI